MRDLLLFTVNDRRYALDLAAVRRVVRMVEVTPLPDPHPAVSGVVNWGGTIVPVLDLHRSREGDPPPHTPSDQLLLAEVDTGPVALAIDVAEGVVTLGDDDCVSRLGAFPGGTVSEEIATVEGEIVVIRDLGRFLAGFDPRGEGAGGSS